MKIDDARFALLKLAWERATLEGVRVKYDDPDRFSEEGDGWFDPNLDERGSSDPLIGIVRSVEGDPYEPQCDETDLTMGTLFTLAHEYGHFRSREADPASPDWLAYSLAARKRDEIRQRAVDERDGNDEDLDAHVRDALARAMSVEERTLIIDEEKRAWQLGRRWLEELGLKQFNEYDEAQGIGIRNHRYRLGLTDRPLDEELGG